MVKDIGHIILQVGNMDEALRLYRDLMGFHVQGEVNPVWTVVATQGGSLTLYKKQDPVPCALKGDDSPISLHVSDFSEAVGTLEGSGYTVSRHDDHQGYVKDPWGNVLWLHDHLGEAD